jgi:hypothetical protein
MGRGGLRRAVAALAILALSALLGQGEPLRGTPPRAAAIDAAVPGGPSVGHWVDGLSSRAEVRAKPARDGGPAAGAVATGARPVAGSPRASRLVAEPLERCACAPRASQPSRAPPA